MEREARTIGEILLQEGLITKKQLDKAKKTQKETDRSLGRILVEMGAITDTVRMGLLKKKYGYEMVSLLTEEFDPRALTIIPKELAQRHNVMPIRMEKDTLLLAMEDPSDIYVLDVIKTAAGVKIKPVLASLSDIQEALKRYPVEEQPVVVVERALPLWMKAVRSIGFAFFWFLPLIIFLHLLFTNEPFQMMLAKLQGFDIFLYMLLGWGAWAAILLEIYGLIFAEERRWFRKLRAVKKPVPAGEETEKTEL